MGRLPKSLQWAFVVLALGLGGCREQPQKPSVPNTEARDAGRPPADAKANKYFLPRGFEVDTALLVRVRSTGKRTDAVRVQRLLENAQRGMRLRERYPEWFGKSVTGKITFECGTGELHQVDLEPGQDPADPEFELTGAQLDKMHSACLADLGRSLGASFTTPASGQYRKQVDAAVATTDKRLDACKSGGVDGRVVQAGGSRKVWPPSGDRGEYVVKYRQLKPSGSMKEYHDLHGGGTHEPSGPRLDEWVVSSETDANGNEVHEYTQTHADGSKTVFTCRKGASKCDAVDEPPPKPQEPPDEGPEGPDEPEQPEEPTGGGTKDSLGGDCFEMDCTSTCQEMKRWWKRFKAECERRGWRTYDCASYVAAVNNCPDPAVVMPRPDQDFVCGAVADDATIAQARKDFCTKLRGVMQPVGPDDAQATCEIRQPKLDTNLFDICSDPRARPTADQCLLDLEVPVVPGASRPTGTGVPPLPTRP